METNRNITNCPKISEAKKIQLQATFDEHEVHSCLKKCAADKAPAPGPDGYTMGFYIKCWDVIKNDIMAAFNNFYEQEMFEKRFNATYIALIPKKKGAKELKDFRPINLIGSFYKLLSKVLTERIKGGNGQVGGFSTDGIYSREANHGCCVDSK